MKAPLVVAIVIVALVGAVAGFYVYDRFNGGSTSPCGDPASISSHIYNPYRLQIVKSCITASGTVDRVIEEADGDVHLRTNLDPAYSNLTNSAIRGMMIRMLVEEDCESYEEFRRNILTHPPLQENWAGQRTLSGYIRNGLDANLVNA